MNPRIRFKLALAVSIPIVACGTSVNGTGGSAKSNAASNSGAPSGSGSSGATPATGGEASGGNGAGIGNGGAGANATAGMSAGAPDAGVSGAASGAVGGASSGATTSPAGDGGVAEGGAARTTAGGASDDGGICGAAAVAVPEAERVANGQPILPPKWAFGVLWGSYYDQVGTGEGSVGNILTAEAQLRSDGYGGDLMWIDSSWLWHDYGGGTDTTTGPRYVCFQFDPTMFPDPGTMIGTLQKDHFHFGVWEWPWMGHGCQYFQTAVTNSYFVMNGATPALATGGWHGDPNPAAFDFTSPAAVKWWAGLNQPLVNFGLDFMKLDTTGDPPSGGTLADPTKVYKTEYHRAAFDVTRAYAEANNPVAQLNSARGFILAHASGPTAANDQLPGMWTDDTDSTWMGFAGEDLVRAAALNTTTTAAFWCGDTGGYGINTANPTDELYIRWLEYSSFTPCQEIFGSKSVGSRFPWRYSTQAQTIAKTYLALRYRLLPFRYSNAQIAYHETPVKYPVSFIGTTQILVGSGQSQFLIQPVTTAGATSATVALPAGSQWINYFTGATYPGGTSPTIAAPIDQEPVLVKAGSIIPMGPPLQWVDQVPADPLTLDIYPAGATSYTLYEDDGISQGYLGGAYSMTTFSADDTSGAVVVSIAPQVTAKYTYAGQLCSRGYVLKINQQATAPMAVMRDATAVPASTPASFATDSEGWYYDATAQTVWVKFPLSSSIGTKVSL